MILAQIIGYGKMKATLGEIFTSIFDLDFSKKKNREYIFLFLLIYYCILIESDFNAGDARILDECLKSMCSKKFSSFDKLLVEMYKRCQSKKSINDFHENLRTCYLKSIFLLENSLGFMPHTLSIFTPQDTACFLLHVIRLYRNEHIIPYHLFTSKFTKNTCLNLLKYMVTTGDCDYSDFLHSTALDKFLLSLSASDTQPFNLIAQYYVRVILDLDILVKFSEMEIIAKDKVLVRSFCSSLFALTNNIDSLKRIIKEDISKGKHYKSHILLELCRIDGDLPGNVVFLLNTIRSDSYHSLFYSYLFEYGDSHFSSLVDLQKYYREILDVYSNLKNSITKRLSLRSPTKVLKLCLIFVSQNNHSIQKLGYLLFKSLIPFLCEKSYGLLVKRILDPKKYPTIFSIEVLTIEEGKAANYNVNSDELDDEAMLKMDTLFEKMFREKKLNMNDISARNLKLFRIICENRQYLPAKLYPQFLADLFEVLSERLPTDVIANCIQALPDTFDSRDVARLLSMSCKDNSKLANLIKALCHIESASTDLQKFLGTLILSNKKMKTLLNLIRSFTKDQYLGLGKYLFSQSFTVPLILALEKLPKALKSEFCKCLESYILLVSHHSSYSDSVSYFVSCILESGLTNFFQKLLMRVFDSLNCKTKKRLYLHFFEDTVAALI